MTSKLEKFLITVIEEKITLGSNASSYNKAKAQRFLDELSEAGTTDVEFKYNGSTYSVWNSLLCVKYDNI
jgi:uncharacterized protein YggL (DUF469 family)